MEPVCAQNGRTHPRVPLIGLVKFESSGKSYSGYLANISEGGLMLKARDLPDPNEEITLSFQLLPSPYVYDLKGVVVWVASQQRSDWPRGMGVRFVHTRKEDQKLIGEYVEKSQMP